MQLTMLAAAIDVGYGQTKLTRSGLRPDWSFDHFAFRSFATPSRNADIDCTGDLMQLNVVPARVGSTTFRAGPDAMRAGGAVAIRSTGIDYYLSDEYLAFVLAALSYMDLPPVQDTIDVLGIGVPLIAGVFQNRRLKAEVAQRIRGTHEVPDLHDRRRTRIVNIKDVCVVSQGVGALIGLSATGGRFTQTDHRTLLIDAGFGTLLWLVASGLQAEPDRSGGAMAGAFSILAAVANDISPALSSDARVLHRIDDAIRLNKPLLVDGTRVNLAQHVPVAEAQALTNLRAMANGVGSMSDIDSIVVCGGASHLFSGALQRMFPTRTITLAPQPQLANLKGYLIRAEHIARKVRG